MAPRPDVSEERRSQIVESAVKVFSRKGFANTRMDDVAGEAGLSKGLLYWYFKSKDEIIVAIADALFSAHLRRLQGRTAQGPTARANLESVLELFIKDTRGLLKVAPLIHELYALAYRNAAVRRAMQGYLDQFVATLEPLIERGMASGEFVPGDARQIALAIGANLEGTLLLWAYAPKMVQVEAQARAGMALLLRGLEA